MGCWIHSNASNANSSISTIQNFDLKVISSPISPLGNLRAEIHKNAAGMYNIAEANTGKARHGIRERGTEETTDMTSRNVSRCLE